MLPQYAAAVAEAHDYLRSEFGYLFSVPNPNSSTARLTLNSRLDHNGLKWFNIAFPKAFPLVSAVIHVDAKYLLVVPHVEAKGKVCLSDDCAPNASAAERVRRLIALFSAQMVPLFSDPDAALLEFQREGLGYWIQYLAVTASKGCPWQYYGLDDFGDRDFRIAHSIADTHQRTGFIAERKTDAHAWLGWSEEKVRDRLPAKIDRTGPIEALDVFEVRLERSLIPFEYPENRAQLSDLLRLLVRNMAVRHACQAFVGGSNESWDARGKKLIVLHGTGFSQGFKIDGANVKPAKVDRLDPRWTISRDQTPELGGREVASVICLGAGSLGSATLELVCRAGAINLTIVDKETLETANLGRHTLTAHALGRNKASAMAERLRAAIPGSLVVSIPRNAISWLIESEQAVQEATLIVDMTGDPVVRQVVNDIRSRTGHAPPLIIGWLEPFAAAAHVAVMLQGTPWFSDGCDPAEANINVARWKDEAFVDLPFCGASFQPYGPAAMAHGAALLAECILDTLDGKVKSSETRSWVRGRTDFPITYVASFNAGWSASDLPEHGEIRRRPWP